MQEAEQITELLQRRRFTTAQRGYSSIVVHRLLGDLRSAHEEGKRLSPLIDAVTFEEVSYGADMTEVEDHLAAIKRAEAGLPAPQPTQPAAPAEVPPKAQPPTPTLPTTPPPASMATPTQPGSDPTSQAVVKLIDDAMFSTARNGYDYEQVDTFLESIEQALIDGRQPPSILEARFEIARPGYDTAVVDAFLEDLDSVMAGGPLPPERPRNFAPTTPVLYDASPARPKTGAKSLFLIALVVFLIMMWLIYG